MTVLLATFAEMPEGEPGSEALDAALDGRGIVARWVCWDDPGVDWAAADLVAVRSTWDYVERYAEFLAWARRVEAVAPVLNGAEVFEWNIDKSYLTRLGDLPVVPTRLVDGQSSIAAAIAEFGTVVVKPRVGAGGRGLVMADHSGDPRLAALPDVPLIAQPLVPSIRTEGELSVFVLDGVAISMVRKLPAAGEIRAHDYRGATCSAVPLKHDLARLALRAVAEAQRFTGRPLDYLRVDLLRHDDAWCVSELEATEPGLYLDLLPANADPFVDLVAARLR